MSRMAVYDSSSIHCRLRAPPSADFLLRAFVLTFSGFDLCLFKLGQTKAEMDQHAFNGNPFMRAYLDSVSLLHSLLAFFSTSSVKPSFLLSSFAYVDTPTGSAAYADRTGLRAYSKD